MNDQAFLLHPPLLSLEDLADFEANEVYLVERMEALPGFQRVAGAGELQGLSRLAAWLNIERAFIGNPSLEGIKIVVDTDEGDRMTFVLVCTRTAGEEDYNDFGQDPQGLDEDIQMYLNDMGRDQHIDFYQELAALKIRANTLESCANSLFGEQWGALRREKRLVEQLPMTMPQAATKAPRF